MERLYYRQYYRLERTHWWFVVRAAILMKFFKRYIGHKPDLRIANIGVATGRTTELLSQMGQVVSVEPDEECCRFLREELNMPVVKASATQLPFPDDTFDVVCAFDVVEHIEDDGRAMQELRRITKKDGWIMITVPAYNWLWSEHDEVNQHFRRYSGKQIARLVTSAGCSIHYQTGFNFLLFLPVACFHALSRLFRRRKKVPTSNFDVTSSNASSFTNLLLKGIFGLEKHLLSFLRMPFGVSFLVMARKN